jgi:single-stranded-DNA-specific exonuclease
VPVDATWSVKTSDPQTVAGLSKELNLSLVTAACLINRGITTAAGAKHFLNPRLACLSVPSGMADLERATDRLAVAVSTRERIGVFGDYDVDGVSSAALLTTFLNAVGVETETLLADRFSGYGMGPDIIDRFVGCDCSLVIAVDCGTSDHEAARRAKEAGIDLIVIDHHRIEGDHPDVNAFINPERKDCQFGDLNLAAVGLVFYFTAALRTALEKRGYLPQKKIDIKDWLDLVALGTVADVMPLTGNNRILVHHGLKRLSTRSRDGIKALARTARIRSVNLRADHIAYQLAPRLNAAGRLGSANEAFELLIAKGRNEAERLAGRLDQLSGERRITEEGVFKNAKQDFEQAIQSGAPVIFVAGDGWHRGVLGIVASRLSERSGKPSFVVGFDGDEGTGSARGQGQINLHEALSSVSEHLVRFGGHRDAAGFTVTRSNLELFRNNLVAFAQANWTDVDDRDIACDVSLMSSEISSTLLAEIAQLGPFGQGNPEPIFEIDGLYVLEKRVVGQDHLKLLLKTPSGTISAFGPRMADTLGDIPQLIRVAANLTADEWRADGTPELRLVAPPIPGS